MDVIDGEDIEVIMNDDNPNDKVSETDEIDKEGSLVKERVSLTAVSKEKGDQTFSIGNTMKAVPLVI